jgi:hypothetical protein
MLLNDDCRFMDEARHKIESNPYDLAKYNYKNDLIVFYSVGAGFAGVVPGFENYEKEFKCVDKTYKIEMIWVGGDVISCDGQSKLGDEVIAWAKKYKSQLRSLLIKSNKYRCSM